MPEQQRTTVQVDGHRLALTNLDKVLYPGSGTTKAEVMQYLMAVAPALLPQLRDRPLTRVRWPHGTGDQSFFEKNLPSGSPRWVRRVELAHSSRRSGDDLVGARPDRPDRPGRPGRSDRSGRSGRASGSSGSGSRGGETIAYPLIDDVAGLVWLANLSALELHVHQWRVDAQGRPRVPDRLVIDLDPGEPAGLAECSRVALLVRDALAGVLPATPVPVTSGNKGMQIYVPTPRLRELDSTRALAQGLAETLATQHPELVVARMTKALRPGKVFLDWSQNTRAKTTICPYSLRGRSGIPTVAAPRTWAEIEAAAAAEADVLHQLGPREVLSRLETDGDLMAGV